MNELSAETAAFFMKAPDNNVLEFALASRTCTARGGDAEFILIEAFIAACMAGRRRMTGFTSSLSAERVSVVILNWPSSGKIASRLLRDNDGNYQAKLR